MKKEKRCTKENSSMVKLNDTGGMTAFYITLYKRKQTRLLLFALAKNSQSCKPSEVGG